MPRAEGARTAASATVDPPRTPRPGLISRRDLLAALDDAAARRVTIISAPAGSGKTSLLRTWADHTGTDRRIVFLTVRPGQADAHQFWLALHAVIRAAAGGDPPSPTPGFEGRAMVARILTELAGLDGVTMLVIDDLHELHSTDAIGQLIELLTNLPAAVHAVVATRRDAPLRLHQLRLAGELAEIRAAQLRFTADEARQLLAAAGVDLPQPLITALYQRTEGWAAGLRLAALALAGHPDPEAFVVAVDAGRTWFRYHRQLADTLALQLRRTEPTQIPKLHRLAAGWLAAHAQPVDAIGHLQAAGDWNAAARLLTEQSLSLTLDGRANTVATLLHAFPAPADDAHPELALVATIADLDAMRLDQAAAHLQAVRTYATNTPPARRAQLQLAIASLDLLLARLRGHFDGILALVDALPPPIGGNGAALALDNDLRALALMNLGVTEAWSLRLADSERHLREGAALARDINRPYLEVACHAHLGFAAIGRTFTGATTYCRDAIELATRYGWHNEHVIAPASATLAGILIWTGEFDDGRKQLDHAHAATSGGGEPGLRLLLHMIGGALHAARGQYHQALAEFTAATAVQNRMASQHALATRVTAWTITTQARLGRFDEAASILAGLDSPQKDTGEVRNAVAALHLARHEPADAQKALRPVLDGTAPVNPYLTRVEAHLLDALAHRDLGDPDAAHVSFEQALDIAEPDRLIIPFAMTGAWHLLDTTPRRPTAHASLVTDILDAVHSGTAGASTPASAPPEHLSPGELRVLRYLPTNLTRPEIASELSVSLNTVSTHIRRIYAKLGASDRSSAVQRGRELRLLSARGHSGSVNAG